MKRLFTKFYLAKSWLLPFFMSSFLLSSLSYADGWWANGAKPADRAALGDVVKGMGCEDPDSYCASGFDGQCNAARNCRFFVENLRRDSFDKTGFPPLAQVFDEATSGCQPIEETKVQGKVWYDGLFPRSYSYTIQRDENCQYIAKVNILVRNIGDFTENELSTFKQHLEEALAKFWLKDANPYFEMIPSMNGRRFVPFKFKLDVSIISKESSSSVPDYTIKFVRDPDHRGPYDSSWSINWPPFTIAHELGHTLGLEDEYKLLAIRLIAGHPAECSFQSLMCPAGNYDSQPQMYHFYIIIRRALLSPSAS